MLTSRPDFGFGVWRRTSPFAIVLFLGATVRTIARSYIQLAASFGAITYLTRFDFLSGGSLVGLAILVAGLVIGAIALLRYWFFRFKLEEDRVLIRQGFLKRTALDLPFDRVQGINVERSLVDRMLGLVTVRLDTAGSVVAEGRLPAVSTELADWVRTRVDGGRRRMRAGRSADMDGQGQPADREGPDATRTPATRTPTTGQTLLRLTVGDMLRIGLADRKALVFAGAFAALVQAAKPFDDVIVRTAFRSRGGLLTQKEVVVETAKIQQLTLSQNLVLRWFGRYRFGALPAGAVQVPESEGSANLESAENLSVPLLDSPKAEQLRRQVFGPEARGLTLLPGNPAFTRVSPVYIRVLILRACVVSFLAGAIFFLTRGGPAAVASVPYGIWCLLSTALSALIALQSWRRRGYLHDDDGLASRKGLVGSRVDACLFRKVQTVTVTQSPPQRRKGLATLRVHLSSGVVTVPRIARETAARLRDYILCKVESSRLRRHWTPPPLRSPEPARA